ncbi:ketoacyl-synt-domain-containing protein [Aspergillus minisclerotigenes]|uniref:Ketoacyl-synt-domain-containing protein n=1 Tax=Aspergillus minisclerotigenes TaxID=656917 RepID=A0A5N6JKV7_9EURO|nr:ketoacyl-synt-domain-containing protein [Aspergillus minisclerotigenes]
MKASKRYESTPGNPCNASNLPRPSAYTPIAIVGMAMRLPGGIRSDKEFWDLMVQRKDARCEVPASRYNVESFYSDSKMHTVKTKYGYFLEEDPAYFDAPFFSISSYEAARLDPQQRMLLEVVWECMENAGQQDWKGKDIGCYVGVFGEDWLDLSSKDTSHVDRYHVLGTGNFALANRVSYEYDLKGPSMSLQTGCSSSLVGLHEACQALQMGDCAGAIVAGSNLILTPTMTTTMSDNMVLSPDGICKTFDANADGYGRGEAINAIYIKPLDTALRDGDPIRAIIRSTSTNCDGKTPSITMPGSATQRQLIEKAYERAEIEDITETAFFELHGTGTAVGDRAETSVVAELFRGKGTYIGAVKPNVGHSEGASGITSVIKAVLALEHQVIPPNIHFNQRNPQIPFEEAKLQVPITQVPWPRDRKLRVSVNCFGIGGANAHVILDSSSLFRESSAEKTSPKRPQSSYPLLLSAGSQKALQSRIRDIRLYIDRQRPDLRQLAHTLSARREHLQYRTYLLGQDDMRLTIPDPPIRRTISPSLTFVFTGQGAAWVGMGKELLQSFPCFANTIDDMEKVLQNLEIPPKWRIREELLVIGEKTPMDDPELSQPLCTAVQIGIVNLLSTWGVYPASVIGHSSGEIAAAYAAKAIPLSSAIILAYYRGKIAKQSPEGAMAALGMSSAEFEPYMTDGIMVACENSPQSITISGDVDKINKVLLALSESQPSIFQRRLAVNVAYHSHHMHALGDDYEAAIRSSLQLNEEMVPLYSTMSGDIITTPRRLDAHYWRQNLESPVLFSTAMNRIVQTDSNDRIFLEIGPHSALSGPVRQTLEAANVPQLTPYIPAQVRGRDQVGRIWSAIGELYTYGIPIDFHQLTSETPVLTDLPAYPWDHDVKLWNEATATHRWRFRQFPEHELLGSLVPSASNLEPVWRNILRYEDVSWLNDHRVAGHIVFPAAGYVAMIGEAIRQVTNSEGFSIKNMCFKTPLILHDMLPVEVVTTLKRIRLTDTLESDWYDFAIMADNGKDCTRHCHGQARLGSDSYNDLARTVRKPFPRHVPAQPWYRAMKKQLKNITADPRSYRATATVADTGTWPEPNYSLHPIIIDQAIQLGGVAACQGLSRRMNRLYVPAFIERLYVSKQELKEGTDFWLESTPCSISEAMIHGNALVAAGDDIALSIQGAILLPLESEHVRNLFSDPLSSHIEWKPDFSLLPPGRLLVPPCKRPNRALLAELVDLCFLEAAYIASNTGSWPIYLRGYRDKVHATTLKTDVVCRPAAPGSEHCMLSQTKYRRSRLRDLTSSLGEQQEYVPRLANAMVHTLDNLPSVLAGAVAPDQVVDQKVRDDILFDPLSTRHIWHYLLSLLGHSNPKLKVLELTGGASASTEVAIECLRTPTGAPAYSNYTWAGPTEVSIASAKERLVNHKDITFKVLNPGQDPLPQGFKLQEFDLVIACHALRSVRNVEKCLQNIHKLLAPGGCLLVQEPFQDIPCIDFIMGILPDWHMDREQEEHGVRHRWDLQLRNAGFDGVDSVAFDDQEPFRLNINLLSKKKVHSLSDKGIRLVHGADRQWAQRVKMCLENNGHTVSEGTLEDGPTQREDTIFLLDLESPFLSDISEAQYAALKSYLTGTRDSRILWVTQCVQTACADPCYALILGLARSIRNEMMLDIATLELDTLGDTGLHAIAPVYQKFQQQVDAGHAQVDYEYSLVDGTIYTGRFHWFPLSKHFHSPINDEGPKKLSVGTVGSLDTLEWIPAGPLHLNENEVEVEVRYCGVNFKDVMISMGVLGKPEDMGLEGSGVVRKVGTSVKSLQVGDRVVLAGKGIFQTRIIVPERCCLKVPQTLSLEQAATMPVVYATAIHSLVELGGLRKGQSVLIHSACGGVGLAAIQVCQAIGAEIYTTVGNQQKRDFLKDTFNISESRIFDSRSTSFLPSLMRETNGKGVNIVLNSLSGKLLHASWQCVAEFGRMIELGKRDFLGHGMLAMDAFESNRAFFGVDMARLGEERPDDFQRLLEQSMQWLVGGRIQPIRPTRLFDASQIVDAFRYMQKGVHLGKILINIPEAPSELPLGGCKQAFALPSTGSYLLVGGLGGLGKAASTWMAEKGARHIVYLSRSAGAIGHVDFIREMEAQGCTVSLIQGDVCNPDDVRRAVSSCDAPLLGVIQMSAVLDDRSFIEMSYDDWYRPINPKVVGTWNLHNATVDLDIEFFVVFSSISGLCGNAGQANYASANTYLDSFVQHRRGRGLPASVLNLGVVEEIGCATENQKVLDRARASSLRLLQERHVLDSLQVAISRSRDPLSLPTGPPTCSVLAIGMEYLKPVGGSGIEPIWGRDARFSAYIHHQSSVDHETGTGEGLRDLMASIQQCPEDLDKVEVRNTILSELAKLCATYQACSPDTSDDAISHVAIDSLMCMEISNYCRRKLVISISTAAIAKAGTLGGLTDLILEHMRSKYLDCTE